MFYILLLILVAGYSITGAIVFWLEKRETKKRGEKYEEWFADQTQPRK